MANTFQLTEEQKEILKEVENEEITSKQRQLLEKFCHRHAVPCYNLKRASSKPSPLDSSIGGIPYCPVDEELPKDKNGDAVPLLLQINFAGVELPGYPDKGIFQLFMKEDSPNLDYHDVIESGNYVRYYENITDSYRKDIPYSNHRQAGKGDKIKLEKSWSMYSFTLSSFLEEDEYLFKDCEIYKQFFKEDDFCEILENFWDELFPQTSNIGGYGCTPQGQASIPYSVARSPREASLLFLADDIISWGDCGCIKFFYEDIRQLKKDASLWGYGDMS